MCHIRLFYINTTIFNYHNITHLVGLGTYILSFRPNRRYRAEINRTTATPVTVIIFYKPQVNNKIGVIKFIWVESYDFLCYHLLLCERVCVCWLLCAFVSFPFYFGHFLSVFSVIFIILFIF